MNAGPLVCRFCFIKRERNKSGYAAAIKVANVAINEGRSARVTTSWRCDGCGKMNTQGEPEQLRLC